MLKLAVCAPVTDSGVICLHHSVTDIPEVGVVGNAVLPIAAVLGCMAETSAVVRTVAATYPLANFRLISPNVIVVCAEYLIQHERGEQTG